MDESPCLSSSRLMSYEALGSARVRRPYVDDKPASRTSFFDLGRNDLLVISSYSFLNIVAVETQCAGEKWKYIVTMETESNRIISLSSLARPPPPGITNHTYEHRVDTFPSQYHIKTTGSSVDQEDHLDPGSWIQRHYRLEAPLA